MEYAFGIVHLESEAWMKHLGNLKRMIEEKEMIPFKKPWQCGGDLSILDESGNMTIAQMIDGDEDNAEFIVRACNAHEALVEQLEIQKAIAVAEMRKTAKLEEAVKNAIGVMIAYQTSSHRINSKQYAEAIDTLQKAIAKAEEK